MRAKISLFLFLALCAAQNLGAQTAKKPSIVFQPVFGDHNLYPGVQYGLNNGDSVVIDELKIYVSGIELLENNAPVWKEENSFHLVDISDSLSCRIPLNIPEHISFDHIKFKLGIDSTVNVAGAMGGDLDPTKGMYWTWQSGYINLKLEGQSNFCTARNKRFQFHLGGYQYPYNSVQTVLVPARRDGELNVLIDIKQFIGGVDLAEINQVMSPGKEAVSLAEKAGKIFRVR